MGETRVLLVDDHDCVLLTLRQMLEIEDDIVVVGESGHGSDALAQVRAVSPEVVAVVDLSLGDVGLATVRMLRARGVTSPILFLTMYDTLLEQAIDAGATGYLSSDARRAGLVGAIRRLRRVELDTGLAVSNHAFLGEDRSGPLAFR